jgi:hypothetical protein
MHRVRCHFHAGDHNWVLRGSDKNGHAHGDAREFRRYAGRTYSLTLIQLISVGWGGGAERKRS